MLELGSQQQHNNMEFLIYPETLCHESWRELIVIMCHIFGVIWNPIFILISKVCLFFFGGGVNPD